ncbi:MAG: hypothetical protein ACREMQ_11110 [Longimicrobiales bacterium]
MSAGEGGRSIQRRDAKVSVLVNGSISAKQANYRNNRPARLGQEQAGAAKNLFRLNANVKSSV